MWLLVIICVSSVGAVPINQSQGDVGPPAVGVVPVNKTHNFTDPAPGVNVSITLEPQQRISAETLEELLDNMVVQEGDILMPEDRNAVETLWADAVVPYLIGADLAHRASEIQTAFRMISDFTCIRFVPRSTEYNYLNFLNKKGCASFVGCRGGAQPLYYARSCSVGNLCHEIIHALGLHHEHTRQDRDQYVSVHWQSIIPARQNNFKMKHGNTLNLPYDVNSIMHYGKYYFSQDGGPTLMSKRSGDHMGQRTHLTQLDVQRLNRLYHCDERMRSM